MVVPQRAELLKRLSTIEEALFRAIENKLQSTKDDLNGLVKRLTDPGRKLRENQQRLDELSVDLLRRLQDRLRQFKERLATNAGRLDALSPLAVLERGYSIAHKIPEETIVKDGDSLVSGDRLRITFARGKAICRVEKE
jgi:exodeoxyribonuclease VII large subunit